ncbi:MAG: type II and III secretion system protein [bacterium]|nr:type II and III secretion system protein [bacterium]
MKNLQRKCCTVFNDISDTTIDCEGSGVVAGLTDLDVASAGNFLPARPVPQFSLRSPDNTRPMCKMRSFTPIMIVKNFAKFRLTLLLSVVVLAASGCADSMQQYVKLAGWSHSPDEPVVISGNSESDISAFKGSFQEMSKADWRVLEKIAPKPIWERIARSQYQTPVRKPALVATKKIPPTPPQRIPVTKLLNGKVRFFYTFRHIGGPKITTRQDPKTKERSIVAQANDLGTITKLLEQNLGDKATLTALPTRNGLSVTCAPAVMNEVAAIISDADIAPRQVEISARIFEVSHDFDFQYGAKTVINHIASDNTQGVASAFSARNFVSAVSDPVVGNLADPGGAMRLMQVMQSAGVTLDLTFQALANSGMVKVVAAPRMTVDSGQTAYMQAGQEMPIQTAEIHREQAVVTRQLIYKPIGVQMHVTPQATGTDSVKLHVVTSLSAISGFSPLPTLDSDFAANQAMVNPIIDSREAITHVTIKDKNTLVIGGMKMIRKVNRESKIPGLGDIAFIEWLFKNQRTQKQVNDLYFFVTPRLIRKNRQSPPPTLYYARTPPA